MNDKSKAFWVLFRTETSRQGQARYDRLVGTRQHNVDYGVGDNYSRFSNMLAKGAQSDLNLTRLISVRDDSRAASPGLFPGAVG